jgi:hypothetical protein
MSERKSKCASSSTPTRRQLIAGVAMAVGGVALGSNEIWAGAEEEISRTAESIHQEPVFKASRKRVYDALTDANQFNKVIRLSAAGWGNTWGPDGKATTGNRWRNSWLRARRKAREQAAFGAICAALLH